LDSVFRLSSAAIIQARSLTPALSIYLYNSRLEAAELAISLVLFLRTRERTAAPCIILVLVLAASSRVVSWLYLSSSLVEAPPIALSIHTVQYVVQ
jgi:hypothetical protein